MPSSPYISFLAFIPTFNPQFLITSYYLQTCTLTRPSLSSHLLSPQHPPLLLLLSCMLLTFRLSGRPLLTNVIIVLETANSRPALTLTNVRAPSQVVSEKMLEVS